jgi:deoxyribodipyrimidine photo-lyase
VLPICVFDEVSPRRWVPELAGLSAPDIHKSWGLSTDIRDAANHNLRNSYCKAVVDHKQARTRALQAFEKLRDTLQQ